MAIWKILIWKEWEEHKWKLLALTAIVMSVYLAMLSEELTLLPKDAGHVLFATVFSLATYAFFAPLFVAMSVCTAEHSSRSIEFVRAQPVSMQQAAAVRLAVGLCVIIVPIICCCLCSFLLVAIWPNASVRGPLSAGRLPESWTAWQAITACLLIAVAVTINVYAWIVAVAVNQRTEFRAGMIGLLTVVALVVIGMNSLSGWDNRITQGNVSVPYLVALMSSPLASLGMVDFVHHSRSELVLFTAIWQAVLIRRLSRVMINRYGRDGWFAAWADGAKTRPQATSSNLGPAMKSPWWALFWMQMCQTLPVGLLGLAVVCITLLFLERGVDPTAYHAFLGCVLALIIGVGSFVHELEPKLHTFWRSRPISPSAWFWLKFTAGFFVLVVLFDLPYVVLAALKWVYPYSNPTYFEARWGHGPLLITAFFPMLLHLLAYSMAVLAACGIRNSVYATVLALCAVLVIVLLPEVDWLDVPKVLSFLSLWYASFRFPPDVAGTWIVTLPFLSATALVAAIALPATLLAAWLIKRDIALNA